MILGRALIPVFLSTLSVLVTLCAGEVALRLFRWASHRPQSPMVIDHALGWQTRANYVRQDLVVDAAGTSYQAVVRTNAEGFRTFGQPHSDRPALFFIGDSFTFAGQVSNGKTYYDLLGARLPVEVFAYGADGYGSLQEYMVLDRHLDRINPDLVVWQFCSNDFVNNHYALEARSADNNNGLERPYVSTAGTIVRRLPKPWWPVRSFANNYSVLLYWAFNRYDRATAASRRLHGAEVEIATLDGGGPEFREAVDITRRVMQLVRDRAGSRRILAFTVDTYSPYNEAFRSIAAALDIAFVEDVPHAIETLERGGQVARVADGAHWNEAGHAAAAAALEGHIARRLGIRGTHEDG